MERAMEKEKLLWKIADLAEALGRSENSIRQDISKRRFHRCPPPVKLSGRAIVWVPEQVRAWVGALATVQQQQDQPQPITAPAPQPERRRRGRPRKQR